MATIPNPHVSLPADALNHSCDPASLAFNTTDDLPDLNNVIGQPRAIRALQLGSEVGGPGYNTFVLGIPGSGRTTLSREYLERKAAAEPIPDDWCYVNDFSNPLQPRAIRLPAGRGIQFSKDIRDLIQRCQTEFGRVFESEEYVRERDSLVSEVKTAQESEFSRLQQHVEKSSFLLVRTTFGFVLAPAVQGKPLKPEELENLSADQREKLSQLQAKLSEEVEKTLNRLKAMEITAAERISQLDERTVLFLLTPMIDALKVSYEGVSQVLAHLDILQKDIVANSLHFRRPEPDAAGDGTAILTRLDWMRRYVVNTLVDNSELKGAPVILENHPSYPNLLGRIEHEVVMGATRTDFTLIRPGALHRANGGYLVIPAHDLLINQYAWEGLKRVLRDSELRMVELAAQLGLVSTVTLEPEPIPLQVKVVMVGTPTHYYLLRAYDEDFAKLFKVRAEFAISMERTPDTEYEYGLFVKSVVDTYHLPAFDRTAVARIIEFSSRLAEDQSRLSTRFGKIADLVREAAYWAATQSLVDAAAVQKAIDENIYRGNLFEERLQEQITSGTFMIDTRGVAAGQINGLSVLSLGDYAFGRPSRITASAFPGKGGVVDIERQAQLGGPLHTKGVLILTGLLGSRYGRGRPLNLSANLTFEQSYDGVEGDSASAAEFITLISAIANLPLRQDLAMTGSINQHGQIQAIGGVNEKIEGFFAVCQSIGLTGDQGVIIPSSNVPHLLLRQDVIDAVRDGKFHIYPVQHVDEAIHLFTGLPAGVRQPDGSYPPDTFNYAVMAGLDDFTRAVQPTNEKKDNKD